MSRSVRKTPVCGYYCPNRANRYSEKIYKQDWHRKMRRKSRIPFHCIDVDTLLLPEIREVSDLWVMPKDGKMRFDPVEWPKGMRK